MRIRQFLAAILVCAALPASFAQAAGHWTVMPLGASCMAVNRPAVEFNASPWNSLALVAPEGGGLKLQVWFWPGYANADGNPVLQGVAAGETIEKLSSASVVISDFAVETAQPLPAAFLARLRDGRELAFQAGAGASLTFDAAGMGDVLDRLESCRSAL